MAKLWGMSKLFGFSLEFGKNVAIGPNVNFRAAGNLIFADNVRLCSALHIETNLSVGENSLISSRVSFIGNDHSTQPGMSAMVPKNSRSTIQVGENCWIGYGAILIGPLEITSGTIIGAGSVVTRSIHDGGVYAGAPARRID